MDGTITTFVDALGDNLDVAVLGTVFIGAMLFITIGTLSSLIGTGLKQRSVRRLARDRASGLLGSNEIETMLAARNK